MGGRGLTISAALLAVLALWLLGVIVSEFVSSAPLTQWLPAIVLLPALAYCSRRTDTPCAAATRGGSRSGSA